MAAERMPDLSVVIPTSRPPGRLVPTLRALAAQTLAADRWEVIVVPNGPALAAFPAGGPVAQDTGPEAWLSGVPSPPFRVRLVPSRVPGRAAACDAGIAAAHGRVVLLLDDDMTPQPGALAAHLAEHGPDAGPVGILGAVPVHVPARSGFATRYIARRFGRHLAKLARPGYAIDVRDAYTGFFSLERAVFERVGGFDAGFVEYGNEDGEFAGRLLAAGVPLRFEPDAIAHQAYDKTFLQLAEDHVAKGRTAAWFLRRHPDRAAESPIRRARRGPHIRRVVQVVLRRVVQTPARRRAVIRATAGLARVLEPAGAALADQVAAVVLDACFWAGVRSADRATAPQRGRTVVQYTDALALGGAERVLAMCAIGLGPRGWRSSVVLHEHPAVVPLRDELVAAGVTVRSLPPRRGPLGLASLPGIARSFRRLRPDVVHIHRPWAPAGIAAVLAARLAGVPAVVATEHLYVPGTPRRILLLRRLVDRLVGTTIAVSRPIGDVLTDRFGAPTGRVELIPNGIEPPEAPPASAVRAVRASLDLPPGMSLIVVPARLEPQKGHAVLLEALAALSDVVAVFAGEGSSRAAIQAEAHRRGVADRVRLVGHRADLPTLLVAADLVVLPSLDEGLPLAALEAMALGRVVVATRVGGLPDLIEDGVHGRLVPPSDPLALAQAIGTSLADPAGRAAMGGAAAERIRTDFSRDGMLDGVEAVYRALLDRAAVSGPARTAAGAASAGAGTDDRDGASLRDLDWRFLAGRPRFGTAVRLDAAATDPRPVAERVARLDQADGASVDLATASDMDVALARRVHGALADDGALLVTTRRPVAVTRDLRRAGFPRPRTVAPWPDARTPRAWLPLDDPAATEAVLGRSRSGARARVSATRRTIWRLRAARGLAGPVLVVAGRSGHPATRAAEAAWATDHGRPPGALTWTLLTGGTSASSKVVAIGTATGAVEPAIVVKWPRTPVAGAALGREAATLTALAARAGDTDVGAPALLGRIDTPVGSALIERRVRGLPLARVLTPERHERLADAVVDRLVTLAAGAAPVPFGAWWTTVGEPVAQRFTAATRGAFPTTLVDRARDLLAVAPALPLVVEHRDAAPWNVLVDEHGVTALVDWESSVTSGAPLVDLWYFLAYLGLAVLRRPERELPEVYRSLTDPGTVVGRVTDRAVARYLERTGTPAAAVPGLRAFTWMIHAPSEIDRLPTGSDPSSSTFVRLWRQEVG